MREGRKGEGRRGRWGSYLAVMGDDAHGRDDAHPDPHQNLSLIPWAAWSKLLKSVPPLEVAQI